MMSLGYSGLNKL